MSKVTITIDDTNPSIVALFGENSAEFLADALGYPPKVAKTEDELPTKVEREYTHPITGITETILDYPEGTEFDKLNDEPKPAYLGRIVTERAVMPMLLSYFEKKITAKKTAEAKAAVDQAKSVLMGAVGINVE